MSFFLRFFFTPTFLPPFIFMFMVGGSTTFCFFKSLDIDMVHTLGTYIFSYSDNCRKKSYGFKNLVKLESSLLIFEITLGTGESRIIPTLSLNTTSQRNVHISEVVPRLEDVIKKENSFSFKPPSSNGQFSYFLSTHNRTLKKLILVSKSITIFLQAYF